MSNDSFFMHHKLPAMNAPRALLYLRWVLAWFLLALGVAVASPIVQPQAMEVVCSSAGAARILVQTEEGPVELGTQGFDCPLCLLAGPAPAAISPGIHAPARWRSLVMRPAAAPVLTAMAVSPPARGPPFFFSLSYS